MRAEGAMIGNVAPPMPATRHRGWLWRIAGGLALALMASAASATESTLAPAEWKAIRGVISQQLRALKAGDAEKAFGYAAPGIRRQFGDAGTFIAMVRAGYSSLLTARYHEFLDGAVVDGNVIQPLRLIAPDNTVRVALYTMEKQKNGAWRISGCQIAPSAVQAV